MLWTLAAGVLGDRTLAEDVLQEAAAVGWQRVGTFAPGTDFRSWMARIVRLCAMNELRRRGRLRARTAPGDLLEEAPDRQRVRPAGITFNGELEGDLGHFDDAVAAALEHLRPAARAALLLKVVSGLEYAEIARILNAPEGTCMSHVHRARRTLRELLGERYPEEVQ